MKKRSQAKIKIHGRSIIHAEFLFGHFLEKLPAMLSALDAEQNKTTCAKTEKDDFFIIDLQKKKKRRLTAQKNNILLI